MTALTISRGDPSLFVTRPISLALLVPAVAALPAICRKREVAPY